MFARFFDRPDTFSIGVCNGCQLLTTLGVVGPKAPERWKTTVRMDHNKSGRFESRSPTLKVKDNTSLSGQPERVALAKVRLFAAVLVM